MNKFEQLIEYVINDDESKPMMYNDSKRMMRGGHKYNLNKNSCDYNNVMFMYGGCVNC